MAEVLWKFNNYPVEVGGITVIRAQDFGVTTTRNIEEVFQLGNAAAVGASPEPENVTGRLTWFPIHVQVENAIVGVASTTAQVNLSTFSSASGVLLTGPTGARGIAGAKLTSLEYTIDAPTGHWQASAQFSGTSFDRDGDPVTPDTPSGVGSYRSPKVMVRFEGSNNTLLRIKQLTMRLQFTEDKAYELSAENAIDTTSFAPQVTGRIVWHANYDSAGGAHALRPIPDVGSDADITIQVGNGVWDAAGNIKYVIKNAIWESEEQSVRVRARGEHAISYRGTGDATTGGWFCLVIPT